MLLRASFLPDKVCHLIPFTRTRCVILSPLPGQGVSSYPLYPDKVCHLIPFTRTRCVILSPLPGQGVSSYPHYPDKVIPFIITTPVIFTMGRSVIFSLSPRRNLSYPTFTMTGSVILSLSPWQGLSSYSRHPDMVCHFIPITLTRSVILFPSPQQGLSFYSRHPDKVSRLIPVTVVTSVVVFPSPSLGCYLLFPVILLCPERVCRLRFTFIYEKSLNAHTYLWQS